MSWLIHKKTQLRVRFVTRMHARCTSLKTRLYDVDTLDEKSNSEQHQYAYTPHHSQLSILPLLCSASALRPVFPWYKSLLWCAL